MGDPFDVVMAEVQRTLAEAGTAILRWRSADGAERSAAAAALLRLLGEVDVDLKDLEEMVSIAPSAADTRARASRLQESMRTCAASSRPRGASPAAPSQTAHRAPAARAPPCAPRRARDASVWRALRRSGPPPELTAPRIRCVGAGAELREEVAPGDSGGRARNGLRVKSQERAELLRSTSGGGSGGGAAVGAPGAPIRREAPMEAVLHQEFVTQREMVRRAAAARPPPPPYSLLPCGSLARRRKHTPEHSCRPPPVVRCASRTWSWVSSPSRSCDWARWDAPSTKSSRRRARRSTSSTRRRALAPVPPAPHAPHPMPPLARCC
jgi:hypothetical protein